MKIRRGEIYYADLGQGIGSEQNGIRPVIVLQNDTGNRYSKTIIVAPISSKIGTKAKLPTHIYLLAKESGLRYNSIILLEQLRTIDKRRLEVNYQKGKKVSDNKIKEIDNALNISLGVRKG